MVLETAEELGVAEVGFVGVVEFTVDALVAGVEVGVVLDEAVEDVVLVDGEVAFGVVVEVELLEVVLAEED